ncbi:PDC sensor domain-containing protein [Paenibacillus nasutitermitis]|uniref:HTH-type transcriptional regulator YtdP n=1 Tax=Paenibacillus nasutitermitis TaxID=1652958 RepID=A0A917E276_9BACL|nr:helix-turn-helix domain-containing protein [Paenibacillus nasutitermitis]GGD97628.1 putative HTH-type transcriptional regulator YtdP [Paenibacillus nasutitermitis]
MMKKLQGLWTWMRSGHQMKKKLLVSLLLLSSIPVAVIGLFTARFTSSIILDQAYQSNMYFLRQNEKEMEGVFRRLNDLLFQFTYHNYNSDNLATLNRFTNEDLVPANWKMVLQLGDMLNVVKNGMGQALEVDFYSPHYKKIMTSDGNILTEDQFNDPKVLNESRDHPIGSRWIDTRMGLQVNERFTKPVITVICPFMQSTGNSLGGAIIIYFDASELSRLLTLPPEYPSSSMFIANRDGNILMHSNPDAIGNRLNNDIVQELNSLSNSGGSDDDFPAIGKYTADLEGERRLIYTLPSGTKAWNYIISIPMDALTSKPRQTLYTILLISLALILIAIFIALKASRNIYEPVQRLAGKLSKGQTEGRVGDEIQWLDHFVSRVMEQNQKLSEEAAAYFAHMENYRLHQLLLGNPQDSASMTGWAAGQGEAHYALFLIETDQLMLDKTYSRTDQYLFFYCIQNIAQEVLRLHSLIPHILTMHPGLFAVLIPMAHPPGNELLRTYGNEMLSAFRRHLPFPVFIAASHSSFGIPDVHDAYIEAVRALRYRFLLGDKETILMNALEPRLAFQVDVLYEQEAKICAALQAWRIEEALETFDLLTETMKDGYEMTREFVTGFFTRLFASLIKAAKHQQNKAISPETIEPLLLSLAEQPTISDMNHYFKTVIIPLLTPKPEDQTAEKIRIVQEVLDYIHARYDQDISLQLCSDLVHIHPVQLSRIFKQIVEEKFVDYVIAYRMRKATEMLDNPTIKLQDIAEKLRYTSVQNFIRTFKKTTGVTPGQYRKHAEQQAARSPFPI